MHTHGWLDKTVPLEGRAIRSGFVQGDVFSALKTWRETNLCTSMVPDSFTQTADMQTRRWTSCAPASQLEFVLHFNGHSIPQGWSTLALDWFEQF
jgi:polyhydroxybutyrate depolymerase